MPIIGSILKAAIELRGNPMVQKTLHYAVSSQKKVLKKLLKKAQNTAFGEEYGFSEILKSKDLIASFKSHVPTFDYNSIFKKWWYRAQNGEAFVTWPGQVKYFALSSGTSEASSKYIPVTHDMLRQVKKTSIKQIFTLANYNFPPEFYNKGILMLGGSTHLHYNGTYYEGDLSGITAGNIPFWFQYFYKPGKRIAKERDWLTKLDEIVKKAPDWDIGVFSGVPAWLQILMEKIIDHYQVKNIHEIWPNLSIYVHGGVSFAPYKKGFEKLLAHPLTYIETYLASEGFLAFQSHPDTESMQLVVDNGIFFEFVPFNERNFDIDNNMVENPETLSIEDVEEGKDYALLLSTCAGAWRYLIGDTIKFTSKEKFEIQITGRTKHYLNLCGEHLSQENMNMAIKKVEDELNVGIREFTVCGIRYNSMFAHKWYLGCDDYLDPKVASERIDFHLKNLNDDYRVERIAAIKNVIVEVLPSSLFYQWMKMKGKLGGQHKFPRVLKAHLFEDWENFVNQYKQSKA
ncbi:MAG: GH3 auxin-responsive promoter family protein [Sphingobacteriales bacterium]|nr:GH3 auxin-responsive promoter family protein [Sphingobacteriales bacterium]